MAGDWTAGTHIELAAGSQIAVVNGSVTATVNWYAVQPSGRRVWTPGGTPFSYTSDPNATINTEIAGLAQALADAEGVPVVLPSGQTVKPT